MKRCCLNFGTMMACFADLARAWQWMIMHVTIGQIAIVSSKKDIIMTNAGLH